MSGVKDLKIFSGTAHPDFAKRICSELGVRLSAARHYRFSDGEIGLSIDESVRGADVFVIQPTSSPTNDNLFELLIMLDAFRRASASRINVVTPYFGYARQDRKSKPREPITAKLVANLLTHSGADRVITADLHAGQIQGFFDIPVDHLTGMPLLASHFETYSASYDLEYGQASVEVHKTDVVKGQNILLLDDLIATGGTLNAARSILEEGGAKVVGFCGVVGSKFAC